MIQNVEKKKINIEHSNLKFFAKNNIKQTYDGREKEKPKGQTDIMLTSSTLAVVWMDSHLPSTTQLFHHVPKLRAIE